jgi:hypothetical protein
LESDQEGIMVVFERLPERIRKTAQENMSQDEQIKMCLVAGSSISRDYVVITSQRVLVIDERTMGTLGRTYVNVKENVPIDQIIAVDVSRTFMNKLLGQSSMGMQIERYKYLINNGSKKEIQAAAELVTNLAHLATIESE